MKALVIALVGCIAADISLADDINKNVEVIFLQREYKVCAGDAEVDSVIISGRLLLKNNTGRSVIIESGDLHVVRVFKGSHPIDLLVATAEVEKTKKHEIKLGKTFVLAERFKFILFANREAGKLEYLFDYGDHTIAFVLGGTLHLINKQDDEKIKFRPFQARFSRLEPIVCQ